MYLGIDLGTSELKAALVDEAQRIVCSTTMALTISRPQPAWSEQDPEAWWQAALGALGDLQRRAPKAFSAVCGIAVCGQMHGAVILDEQSQVLRPAILWNDGRSMSECRELESRVPSLPTITGNRAMPGFTAPKLLWLKAHEPEVFRRIRRVLLPKDYLVFRLTGEFTTEMSDAAGTLWLDVERRRWSEAMLSASELSSEQMPRLIEGSERAGRLRPELGARWGIGHAVWVAGGAGDNAAAAIGVGAISAGKALLSLGSSGVIFVASERHAANPDQMVQAMCHALPATWCQMTVTLSAATSLAWGGTLTGQGSETLARAAESAEIEAAPIFLPYLNGERAPHNDPGARGVLLGLSAATDAGALAYSLMEGVAFSLADGYAALKTAGLKINRATFVGGGARSRFWGELIASICGFPLACPRDTSFGAALGAARLARLAVAKEDPRAVCAEAEVNDTIEPSAALIERLLPRYERYRNLYGATRHLLA